MTAPNSIETLDTLLRIGVYGVAVQHGKILLITQAEGPYAGKLDLPGGGIEFGETIEEALQREFLEEVNMTFEKMSVLDNATDIFNVPKIGENRPYIFHRIGLLYKVEDVRPVLESANTLLEYIWIDIDKIPQDNSTPFVTAILNEKIGLLNNSF